MLAALLLALAASPCDGPGPVGELGANLSVAAARVEDGVAFVTLRADLWPREEDGALVHGERYLPIELPRADAIVRGATLRTAGGSDALKIEDAAQAQQRIEAFRRDLQAGVEPEQARPGKRRAAAVVSWRTEGIDLHVVAPCSERRIRVDLELEILSTALDGAWRFWLPRPTRDDARLLEAPFSVDARGMEVLVDGASVERSRVAIAGDALVAVDVRPREGPRMRARGGVAHVTARAAPELRDDEEEAGAADEEADTADDEGTASEAVAQSAPIDLLRAEIDLPRPLASPPEGLHLVFVLDASVSSGVAGLAAGWRMLERTLDAAPADARWAAVAIGRAARVVVPAWRSRDDRGAVHLDVENGSDVSGAIRVAQRMADDVDGVGRVIVLSDLAAASDAAALSGSMRPAPLVHVVQLPADLTEEQELVWERVLVDDADMGDVRAIERTGGILVWAGAGDDDERALAPHLIAPTRIDAPAFVWGDEVLVLDERVHAVRIGHQSAEEAGELPALLHAGQGVRADIVLAEPHARAAPAFRGLLWTERVELPLERTSARDRRALALAAVGAVSDGLEDDLVRGAAFSAGVVSRTTSLAHIPEWRPAAVDMMGFGCCGCGCCGCGTSCGFGSTTRCAIGRAQADLKERETLSSLLAADLELCGARQATLSVEVEDLEILDVDPVADADRCVVERFWRHRLDLLAEGSEREPGAFESRRSFQIHASLDEPPPER